MLKVRADLRTLCLKMSPTKEVDYEKRAQRMISRWAGVQSAPRNNADRKENEIFTQRNEAEGVTDTSENEYIIGNK